MKDREIKFRVWNGEQMVSPDYIDRSGTAWWEENSIPTMSKNLMQFTGLLDKNGKEIYEGDICYHHHGWQEGEEREMFEGPGMSWEPGTAQVKNNGWSFYFDDIKCGCWRFNGPENEEWEEDKLEVIGNIYENPELLEPPKI